jgi:hypothetical protein
MSIHLITAVLTGLLLIGAAHANDSSANEKAQSVGQKTGEAVHQVGDAGKEVGHKVVETAREVGHATRDGAREFKKAVKHKKKASMSSSSNTGNK